MPTPALHKAETKAHNHPLVMYDSVTVTAIPTDAAIVAAYIQGDPYPNLAAVKARCPKAKIVTVALHSTLDADCLDIELGGALNSQAADWYHRTKKRIERPIFYTSLSNAQALVDLLDHEGIKRDTYKLWSAHYNYQQHRCGPSCGFGLKTHANATQWTNRAHGLNLDESLVGASFADH